MISEHGLGVIKVKKNDLQVALTKNREEHRGVFLKAQDGYKAAVIAELEIMLQDAKAGRSYKKAITLVAPEDHTKDYDRILTMLKMSVDEELSITETEFTQFVMDDWQWKRQFMATSQSYMVSK